MKILKVFIIALGAFSFMLVLACGPAAETPATPSAGVVAAQDAEPTPEGTTGPPLIEPTDTPSPTAVPPSSPVPEPTEPTPVPTSTAVPMTPEPVPEAPQHPGGLEGCKTLNQFIVPPEEFKYLFWCQETANRHVYDECYGTGSTWEEKQCAYRELEDFKDYGLRWGLTVCAGISDDEDRDACNLERAEAFWTHLRDLIAIWNEITAAVDVHPKVKAAYVETVACIEGKGKEPPGSISLPWQQIDLTKKSARAHQRRNASEDERRAETKRYSVINQCALDTEFYAAQDLAWQEEIWRIHREDPDRVRSLAEAGVIDILEEPGPAPFLTIMEIDRQVSDDEIQTCTDRADGYHHRRSRGARGSPRPHPRTDDRRGPGNGVRGGPAQRTVPDRLRCERRAPVRCGESLSRRIP